MQELLIVKKYQMLHDVSLHHYGYSLILLTFKLDARHMSYSQQILLGE